jgi:hypothetical protein
VKHTTLFTALIVLAGGAAGIQPAEVENVTLQINFNASEVYRSGTQTTPGEYKPSSYPYLSSDEPEALVPYGDTEELTSIYMPDGLVAYYPLDETSGNTANDITTTLPDNDGTHVNFDGDELGAPGNTSTAYKFDGQDEFVDLPVMPKIFEAYYNFTVTVWARNDETNTGKPQQILTPSTEHRFELREDGNGEVIFGWWDGSQFKHGLDFTVSKDTWYHATVVWNSDSNVSIYKNGDLEDTTPTDSDAILSIDTAAIGQKGDASNFFNGTIDDVRIYNRSLSQREVERLYNYSRGQPGTEQISATISSGSFLLANTKGGTPSIESRREAVGSRNLLGRIDPSFGFNPSRTSPTTNIVYRSPYNLTGDSFSSASSGISLRNTAGLGDNATVSVTPIG